MHLHYTTARLPLKEPAAIPKFWSLNERKNDDSAEAPNGARLPHPVDSLDLKQLLGALQAVREGDFSTRLPGHWSGIDGKIADAFNDVITTNQRIAEELERVGSIVGKEGRTRYRAQV